jgi:hypothetical protein
MKPARINSRAQFSLVWSLAVRLFISLAFTTSASAASTVVSGITVGPFQLVSSVRVGRTLFNYTYTASVTNQSTAFVANAVATLTSTNGATKVIQGNLIIGDVPTASTVTSTGTFVIQQDRTQPFVPSDLIWVVTGNPIMGAIPPPDPGPAGATTLAGIDANGNGVRDDVERFILIQFAAPAERRALFQYSIAMQSLILSAGSQTTAIQGATQLMRSVECLASVADASDANQVEAAFVNTPARAQAYLAASALISGQYIAGQLPGQLGASCN